MNEQPHSPSDLVSVAIAGTSAIVRVDGRGSFKVSASLKSFGESVIQKKIPLVLVDMSHCIGMDSTFMGVLAGVATRMRAHEGRVVLVNCSPRTRGLVATLGLDQLIASYEAGQTPDEFARVLQGRSSKEHLESATGQDVETVKTMLDAHQNLVDIAPENLPQFKDVLQYLREEVNRKTGGDQENT